VRRLASHAQSCLAAERPTRVAEVALLALASQRDPDPGVGRGYRLRVAVRVLLRGRAAGHQARRSRHKELTRMNLNHFAVVCTLTVVGIAGCGGDPGKKVNAAEGELTSDQQKAQATETDKNAEATRKAETAHAESAGDKNAATSDAKKDVAVAHADLAQDRRDFDAKTKERLAKIDAKAKELKTKSTKLTGKKAADFKAHHAAFTTQRTETATKVTGLETSTSDGWSAAKSDLEKKLDNLESSISTMEKDL
jgi:hypothetical protein